MNLQDSAGRVLIVLVNYNSAEDTIECLESLARQSYHNFQVLVVDNASTDDSMARFLRWSRSGNFSVQEASIGERLLAGPRRHWMNPIFVTESALGDEGIERLEHEDLLICSAKANRGFAAGNNIGLRYAVKMGFFEYVWLLKNDTVVAREALEHMVNEIGMPDSKRTCASRVLDYQEPETIPELAVGRFEYRTEFASTRMLQSVDTGRCLDRKQFQRRLNDVSACSWLVPISFVKSLGPAHEDLELYGKALDWSPKPNNRFVHTCASQSMVWRKERLGLVSYDQERESSTLAKWAVSI